MATLKYKDYVVEYKATKGNVQIVNSYKIRPKAAMQGIVSAIKAEAKKLGYTYKRSNSSWVTEWRAHNYMYDKGIERARTASVDLNENESFLRRLAYEIQSLLYRP